MLSKAKPGRNRKLESGYNATRARGGWCWKQERGNGEPDEPFRPCDLHACQLTRALPFPAPPALLIIASKSTKLVTPPLPARELVPVQCLRGFAFPPMRLGEKRAHLGGVGGEPPTVLPSLLVLADKCFRSRGVLDV